jgi:hypothetical protein
MAPIDWTRLLAAAPDLIGAFLFSVFALAVIGFVFRYLDRRDDKYTASQATENEAWRKALAEERALTVTALTGIIAEVKQLLNITVETREAIVRHDTWEQGQSSSILGAVTRNEALIKSMDQEQRRLRETLMEGK